MNPLERPVWVRFNDGTGKAAVYPSEVLAALNDEQRRALWVRVRAAIDADPANVATVGQDVDARAWQVVDALCREEAS